MSQFQPYLKIKKSSAGRSLVIPDIHGCYKTFNELLKKINLKKKDQLFLLGDYVGKSKYSNLVIDRIIHLIKNQYLVYPLRGNHEDKMLSAHFKEYSEPELGLPSLWQVKGVTDKKRKILPEYLSFIENLPYYYILNEFYLVHAGFNFNSETPFQDYESMLWIKKTVLNEKAHSKRIIHGHSVKPIDIIRKSIINKNQVIGLDNGCIYKNKSFQGNLLCLNLDDSELTIQKNIESN